MTQPRYTDNNNDIFTFDSNLGEDLSWFNLSHAMLRTPSPAIVSGRPSTPSNLLDPELLFYRGVSDTRVESDQSSSSSDESNYTTVPVDFSEEMNAHSNPPYMNNLDYFNTYKLEPAPTPTPSVLTPQSDVLPHNPIQPSGSLSNLAIDKLSINSVQSTVSSPTPAATPPATAYPFPRSEIFAQNIPHEAYLHYALADGGAPRTFASPFSGAPLSKQISVPNLHLSMPNQHNPGSLKRSVSTGSFRFNPMGNKMLQRDKCFKQFLEGIMEAKKRQLLPEVRIPPPEIKSNLNLAAWIANNRLIPPTPEVHDPFEYREAWHRYYNEIALLQHEYVSELERLHQICGICELRLDAVLAHQSVIRAVTELEIYNKKSHLRAKFANLSEKLCRSVQVNISRKFKQFQARYPTQQ